MRSPASLVRLEWCLAYMLYILYAGNGRGHKVYLAVKLGLGSVRILQIGVPRLVCMRAARIPLEGEGGGGGGGGGGLAKENLLGWVCGKTRCNRRVWVRMCGWFFLVDFRGFRCLWSLIR